MSNRFQPPTAEELARRGIGAERVRARNDDGTLKGDDPSTPDVNEAWTTKVIKSAAKRPAKQKGAK